MYIYNIRIQYTVQEIYIRIKLRLLVLNTAYVANSYYEQILLFVHFELRH